MSSATRRSLRISIENDDPVRFEHVIRTTNSTPTSRNLSHVIQHDAINVFRYLETHYPSLMQDYKDMLLEATAIEGRQIIRYLIDQGVTLRGREEEFFLNLSISCSLDKLEYALGNQAVDLSATTEPLNYLASNNCAKIIDYLIREEGVEATESAFYNALEYDNKEAAIKLAYWVPLDVIDSGIAMVENSNPTIAERLRRVATIQRARIPT